MALGIRNKLASSKEQVKEAYENGSTLRQIADAHGVSAGTVRNCLVEMGVNLRARGRKKKQDKTDEKRLLPLEDTVNVPVDTTPTPSFV